MGKILVPIDGSLNSVRGLEKAVELARKTDSSVTLLHVAMLPPVHIAGHLLDKVKKILGKKKLINLSKMQKTDVSMKILNSQPN